MSIPEVFRSDEKLRTLAMAVARNRVGANKPIETVLAAEFVQPAEFDAYLSDPVFRNYVKSYAAAFEKNGVSFELKCRALAEDAIQSMYHMSKDPDAPAAARVKAVENLVEWGNLAPKADAGAGTNRSGFSITIQLPNTGPVTISAAQNPAPLAQNPEEDAIEGELGAADDLGGFLAAVNTPATTPLPSRVPENLSLDAVFADIDRVLAAPTPSDTPISAEIDPDYA